MSEIIAVKGYEILDSRGNPTVEAEVIVAEGFVGRACAPSGASTGAHEAYELRDNDKKRFHGKGVLKAANHINDEIQKALIGQDVSDQEGIDSVLLDIDGSHNKKRLGANAIVATSLAVAKAAACEAGQDLYQYLGGDGPFLMPVPQMNIINGGRHADNNLDIQEFMIIPAGAPTFAEALRYGAEIFYCLKQILHERNLCTAVGDEGGFAPNLASNEEALDLIVAAIERADYQAGEDIYLGLDVASSEFYKDGLYHLRSSNNSLSSTELTDFLIGLVDRYPIISLEDGMAENDWKGWSDLTTRFGNQVQLVGDDIFVTNAELIQRGINEDIANAVLIKPNQIGTLTETIASIGLAKSADYSTIISHRSGETEDTTIADLAVATAAGQIKTGSLCRTDRVAKYNQLLRIENALGDLAPFPGREALGIFD